eukprot:UN33219
MYNHFTAQQQVAHLPHQSNSHLNHFTSFKKLPANSLDSQGGQDCSMGSPSTIKMLKLSPKSQQS